MVAVDEGLFGGGDVGVFDVDQARVLVDVLLAKLNLECLELDFLAEEVKLAVVADVVELDFVFVDFCLRLVYFSFSAAVLRRSSSISAL